MTVRVTCPGCKQRLQMGEDRLGTSIKCPKCSQSIMVPASAGSGNTTSVQATPSGRTAARPAARAPGRAASGGRGHGGLFWFLMLTLMFVLGAGAGGAGVFFWARSHYSSPFDGLSQLADKLPKGGIPKIDFKGFPKIDPKDLPKIDLKDFPKIDPKDFLPKTDKKDRPGGEKTPAKEPEKKLPGEDKQPKEKDTAKTPEPPTAKVIAAADWKEYKPDFGNFRVEMPGAPTRGDFFTFTRGCLGGHHYTLPRAEADLWFQAGYQKVHDESAPKDPKQLFDDVKNALASPWRDTVVVEEKDAPLGSLPGREYYVKFMKNTKAAAVVRIVWARGSPVGRAVGVIVWGKAATPATPEVRKFLDSLKLTDKDAVAEAPKDKTPPDKGPPGKDTAKPPEPPPAKVIADADWKEYRPDFGDFRVEMPGAPMGGVWLAPDCLGGHNCTKGRGDVNLYFQAGYQTVQGTPKDTKKFFDGLRGAMAGPAQDTVVVEEKDAPLGPLPGREYHVKYTKGTKGAAVARFVFAQGAPMGRAVGVVVWGKAATPVTPEVRRFLDSLKLTGKDAVAEAPKDKTPPDKGPPDKGPKDTPAGGSNEKAHATLRTPAAVTALSSPDAKTLVSVCKDTVIVWDLDTLAEKSRWTLPKGPRRRWMAVTADGKTAIVLTGDYRVDVVDLPTGKTDTLEEKAPIKLGISDPVVACSPDGKYAATIYELRTLKIWDVAGKKLLKAVAMPEGVKGAGFSADGTLLAAYQAEIPGSSGEVTIFESATGAEVGRLKSGGRPGRGAPVCSAGPTFSAKGDVFAVGYTNSQVRFWDVAAKKARPYLISQGLPLALAISPDGKHLVTATIREGIRVSDLATGQSRGFLGGNGRTLAFSADGKKVAVGDAQEIRLWDVDKLSLNPVDPTKVALLDPGPGSPDPKTPPPDPKDPGNGKDPKGPPKGAPKDVLTLAGAIEAYQGVAVDEAAGVVLLALPKNMLKWCSYPDFKQKGWCKLETTAARTVYDAKQQILYALVANAKAKAPLGRRGGHDVHVYKVKRLLEGKVASGIRVAPNHVLPLGTFATQLLLSPDGESLYALDIGDPKSLKVVRLDAAKGERSGEVPVAENTDCLCLSRDGKTLYAGAHVGVRSTTRPKPHQGSIQVIDAAGMKLQRSINVPIDPFSLAATNGGLCFASGGSGTKTDIVVVDGSKDEPVAVWKGAVSGSSLRLSRDQKKLYVGDARSKPPQVVALALPETVPGSETPPGMACPVRVSTYGEIFTTPDGRFLLCESGAIFRLREGE